MVGDAPRGPATESHDLYGGKMIYPARPITPTDLTPCEQSRYFDGNGCVFANTPMNFANRRPIVDFMVKNKLPGMYSRREYVEGGGLMSYGTHVPDLLRRTAHLVDKILKGTKPADIPIEQPTKFELVINMKTAKALGLTIPQELLLRADRVIE